VKKLETFRLFFQARSAGTIVLWLWIVILHKAFSPWPFAWCLILWTVPLMTSIFYIKNIYCAVSKLIAELKVKESVLHVFSSTLVWRSSLLIYAHKPEMLVSVCVQWGCAFLALILFKSEAYSACPVGLCLNLSAVSQFLSYYIYITPHIYMFFLNDFYSSFSRF
jgi:hypothetical protein